MKRRIPHFITLFVVVLTGLSLSSCHTSKKGGEAHHKSNYEHLKKDKNDHERDEGHVELDSKTREKIVKEASGWLGTPYAYGKAEKGEGCDCSGMVLVIYEKITGVKLPRNSAQQKEFCKNLKKNDVEKGDLCFFATGKDPDKVSHVGIMIDEANFIHASSSKGVVISDITQPYYIRTFKGYGRIP